MFNEGDVIDGKYLVEGICSNSGGMGTVLYVRPHLSFIPYRLVLKYCKDVEEENLKRFKREVRLLASLANNPKVVQVLDQNLEYSPPYFTMRYYTNGDLLRYVGQLPSSFAMQESVFLQMIDCVQELHSRNIFHRDIKPQNFLVDGDQIVVSDFGLTTEIGSDTAFTRTAMYWGTHGYIPPEFLNGGFKFADAAGDVFMLGKTIYVLLTQRDPLYLLSDGVSPPLFHIVEHCCALAKENRYQSLVELRLSIVTAYDIILGRSRGLIGQVRQLLLSINSRIEQGQECRVEEINRFVEQVALLNEEQQVDICREISATFFEIIYLPPVINNLFRFLESYKKLVESQNYGFSYAETIATNMSAIFFGENVPIREKIKALELAILGAHYMHRFAAMDTCSWMIRSVKDPNLGLQVATLILNLGNTFVTNIQPSECHDDSIINALYQLQRDT
ncbi:MAG: serine/threonine-protein kinase [Gallionella sp.]|nr:serine/threonine-protein kinase [Gallionella sp.]MDD4958312.1 serine/threonine-protein kinase [Gallionella sp.]